MKTPDIVIALVTAISLSVGYLGGIICFHEIRRYFEDRQLMKDAETRRMAILAEINAKLKATREIQEATLEELRRRGC